MVGSIVFSAVLLFVVVGLEPLYHTQEPSRLFV